MYRTRSPIVADVCGSLCCGRRLSDIRRRDGRRNPRQQRRLPWKFAGLPDGVGPDVVGRFPGRPVSSLVFYAVVRGKLGLNGHFPAHGRLSAPSASGL